MGRVAPLRNAVAKLDRASMNKLGSTCENVAKHRCIKTRVATSWCKMKIDIHEVTQGVAVAKYRVPNRLEHLRKSKDQSDAQLVNY